MADETTPNLGSVEHRLMLLSSMVDLLMAVAVEFFHGDEHLMWSRMGPEGRNLVNEWARLRAADSRRSRDDG